MKYLYKKFSLDWLLLLVLLFNSILVINSLFDLFISLKISFCIVLLLIKSLLLLEFSLKLFKNLLTASVSSQLLFSRYLTANS